MTAGTRAPRESPSPSRRRWPWPLRAVLWLLLALLLLVGALGAGLAWLLGTESGTRWALAQAQRHVPGLVIQGVQGRLLADFSAQGLRYTQADLQIEVDELSWSGLRLGHWQRQVPLAVIELQRLHLARLAVRTPPAAPEAESGPPQPPPDLVLPVHLRLPELRIGRLELPGLESPIEALQLGLHLGLVHRVEGLRLAWQGLQLLGQAEIGSDPSLPLALQLSAREAAPAATASALPDWARGVQAELRASGPLRKLDVQLALQRQDQTLQVAASAQPFAAQPVSRLDGRFERLDLAPWMAPLGLPAPGTRLTGQATLRLEADQPLSVSLALTNALPGPWDAQRLPIRALRIEARGEGTNWTIQDSRWDLADASGRPAGQVDLSGRHEDGRIQAQLRLDALTLPSLDARLPPLRLAGPLELELVLPTGSAASSTAAPFDSISLSTDLSGTVTGGPVAQAPPVQLLLQAQATPTQLEIQALRARAGDARLDAQGRVARSSRALDADLTLDLRRFDPVLWLPMLPQEPWRSERHALNGQVRVQARLPTAAQDVDAWIRGADGKLSVRLADSLLLGQPFDLDLDLQARDAGAWQARAELLAAGNTARVQAQLRWPQAPATGGSSQDDRLQLDIQAPALHRLAPLMAPWLDSPLRGAVALEASAVGPVGRWLAEVVGGGAGKRQAAAAAWPVLTTQGEVRVTQLQAGPARLESLDARWDADLREPARLEARLRAAELRVPGLHLPVAELAAQGTLAAHRITLDAQMQQVAPSGGPVVADSGNGARPQQGTPPEPARARLNLQLGGALSLPDTSARPAREDVAWQGRIDALTLDLATAATLPTVLKAQGQALSWRVAPDAVQVELAPGMLRLLDTPVQWSRARWSQQGQGAPALELDARLDPVAVQPWLRRLQPGFGWEGDLRLGARVSARADPAVRLDVAVFRDGGDLQVREGGTTLPLGLETIALQVQARDGRWELSQRIQGRTLGRIEGAQTVRSDPSNWWPQAQDPVEGRLDLRVEELAAWGAWVPAGWRLGGQVEARMALSGSFGGPQLRGDIQGRALTARNGLQGVALQEGELRIALQGETARIERLRFRGGEGHVELTGDARLGLDPQARLALKADRFAVLQRVDRRVVVSGEADLGLDREQISVRGDFRADEGRIDITQSDAPSLSDDVRIEQPGSRDGSSRSPASSQGAAARALVLDVRFDPGDRFRLRGRGLDTLLVGDIRLTNPRGQLAAHGEIRTERGTFEAYGQSLLIERGVLTFVGEIGNPRLDIVAIRPRLEIRVGVSVGGSVLSPRLRLISEPEMPDTEKLAWLVTGRSIDRLGGAEMMMLQRAAFAMLAGDAESSGFDLARTLQLDELSIRQSDGVVQDTVLAIGKQVSERVYVGYERGLNATTGTWQIVYRIAQRFTLRAQSGDDSAVDLIWIFNW